MWCSMVACSKTVLRESQWDVLPAILCEKKCLPLMADVSFNLSQYIYIYIKMCYSKQESRERGHFGIFDLHVPSLLSLTVCRGDVAKYSNSGPVTELQDKLGTATAIYSYQGLSWLNFPDLKVNSVSTLYLAHNQHQDKWGKGDGRDSWALFPSNHGMTWLVLSPFHFESKQTNVKVRKVKSAEKLTPYKKGGGRELPGCLGSLYPWRAWIS